MRLIYVTGANGAFFPTLIVLLQSFAEQIGGTLPYVCDYGLPTNQREFLRRRGLLLERPPALGPPMAPLREKAIVQAYFRHSGVETASADAVVWLDGDLTLVGCSRTDFEAVVTEMTRRDIAVAASPQGTIATMLEWFRQNRLPTATFEQLLTEGTDTAKPYYSTGLFLCRSPSFLERWSEISREAAEQPVIDQNVFNAVVLRDAHAVLPLDIDIWQTQGNTLDQVQVAPDRGLGKSVVLLDGRPVKILHATSPKIRHVLVGPASFSTGDLVLDGAFKLLRPEPLLDLQLSLLSRFVTEHRTELLEVGLCRLAPPTAGYALRFAGTRTG